MATVRPFKAFVFNPEYNSDMSKLVAPPYDQMRTPQARAEFADRDPANIVQVILPDPADGEAKYDKAAEKFRASIENGVLKQDEKPAFYIYEQESKDFFGNDVVRTGFIGTGKVEEFDAKIVFPHEQTFSKHKDDRLRLVKSTRAYFGQVFMLYDDPEFCVDRIMEEFKASSEPFTSFVDDNNVKHTLWRMDDEQKAAAISKVFEDKKLFIADGHHRYETALNFKREMAAAGQAKESYDFRLMTFVNLHNKGLVILPTHRLLGNVSAQDIDAMIDAAGKYFEVEKVELPADAGDGLGQHLAACVGQDAAEKSVMGLYLGNGRFYKFTYKAGSYAGFDEFEGKVSLDVLILHKIIFNELMGLDDASRKEEGNIDYLRNPADLVKAVDEGKFDAGFVLNPTKLDQVSTMILNSRLMPHKSTDFYPKLYSGVAIYDLEN